MRTMLLWVTGMFGRCRRALVPVIIVALAAGCSPAQADPESVLREYVQTYNAGDADGLRDLFAEDAVVSNYPLPPHRYEGRDEVLAMLASERADAAEQRPWSVTGVSVDGDTVTWNDVWTNSAGQSWCAEGQTAVIEDGRIVEWEVAPGVHMCDCEQASQCDFEGSAVDG